MGGRLSDLEQFWQQIYVWIATLYDSYFLPAISSLSENDCLCKGLSSELFLPKYPSLRCAIVLINQMRNAGTWRPQPWGGHLIPSHSSGVLLSCFWEVLCGVHGWKLVISTQDAGRSPKPVDLLQGRSFRYEKRPPRPGETVVLNKCTDSSQITTLTLDRKRTPSWKGHWR